MSPLLQMLFILATSGGQAQRLFLRVIIRFCLEVYRTLLIMTSVVPCMPSVALKTPLPSYATSRRSRHAVASTPFPSITKQLRRGKEIANIPSQPFFGAMGCTSAIVFTCFGAAYGTAKSGVGISAMGVLRPDLIVKSAVSLNFND